MENKDRSVFVTDNLPVNPNFTGLTKREYFAGLAMQGMLSNEELRMKCLDDSGIYKVGRHEIVAKMAVLEADELLKQLEETKG